MRKKRFLAAILLGVVLCFVVSGVGYGEIKKYKRVDLQFYMDEFPEDAGRGLKEWEAARDESWGLELSLTDARISYMMYNPSFFQNVSFWYDPDGRYEMEFPEGLETKDKILVWIRDNRGIYKTMSGVALLDLFKQNLETIYSFISSSVSEYVGTSIVMDVDIIAKFHSGQGIPLGYFSQGEYRLWREE